MGEANKGSGVLRKGREAKKREAIPTSLINPTRRGVLDQSLPDPAETT